MKNLVLFAGLLAPTLAFANLGDTIASSSTKYGKAERCENEHELRYFTHGYRIDQTYNPDGICVQVTFIRLDGQPFPKADRLSLDRANLPAITRNIPNGWVRQDGWDNVGGGLKNMAAYLWKGRLSLTRTPKKPSNRSNPSAVEKPRFEHANLQLASSPPAQPA
jgi:hypothetical protein